MSAKILKTLGKGPMHDSGVKESSKATSSGSEKEVGWEVQICSDRENWVAKEVHDESTDRASVGDGCDGLVDVGVVEAEEFEG